MVGQSQQRFAASYLEDLRLYSGPIKKFGFYTTDGYINSVAWNPHQPLLDGLRLEDVVEWEQAVLGLPLFYFAVCLPWEELTATDMFNAFKASLVHVQNL